MANDNGSGGAIVMAFILGAITGAAVALLMAPQTGEDTRRQLTERAREGRDKATAAARQSRDFLDRQREHLNDAVEKGKEAYHRARGDKPAEEQA
ncbi:MAG: YtxH domain-containing protein [Vicinamibacteraceae bacterium]|nr:YtxH domain-containing protein [Vicinamibacteraceae bacterium]